MIKLHVTLWQFLAGGAMLGVLGVFAVRARELKGRLRRHLMERKHPRVDVSAQRCPA
jgi:hypothetical protein